MTEEAQNARRALQEAMDHSSRPRETVQAPPTPVFHDRARAQKAARR